MKFFIGVFLAAAGIGSLFKFVSPLRLLNSLDSIASGKSSALVAVDQAFGTHGQKLNIWQGSRSTSTHAPVVVFFYGGGWVSGTRQDYAWAARAYASRGFIVVVPDYRKVPDVVFPAFIQDAADAVRWTHDHIADYGGDPDRIALVGHSAGAYAVAMLALDNQWLTGVDLQPDTIKVAVGLSGPYDFLPFDEPRGKNALGAWPRPLETQPITFARSDAPPFMLVTGTNDKTVRPKNSRNLFKRLSSFGAVVVEKEYPDLGHEDIAMALSRPFRYKATVLDDTSRFMMAHLSNTTDAETAP